MILLDTNVLFELTKPSPSARVVAWLESNEPMLALSTVTLAELRYGVARLPDGKRKSSLLRFWEATRDRFRGRMFAFDERAAEIYGDITADAEKRGQRLNVADAQIAATALVHRMSVATRDMSDFETAGVKVVNPWH